MTHCLKCEAQHYQAVVQGQKTFELRKNDRNFQVGDTIILQEIEQTMDGKKSRPTGDEWIVKITHILSDYKGLYKDYVILGITHGRQFQSPNNLFDFDSDEEDE